MSALRFVPADQQADYQARAADLLRTAYQFQGQRAFESTRRCAALHEAGHCIVNTITAGGSFWRPAVTRIWREPVKGLTAWLGETLPSKKAPPLQIDARTRPMDCLTFGLQQLGGIASELLFDAEDYRAGSSVDEWMVAGGCARSLETIGMFNTGEEALARMFSTTRAMLTVNRPAVLAIADQLEQQRRIEGAALEKLLRDVRP